jgi:deoxyribose-phosphate aldolase
METMEIISQVDHTVLSPAATFLDVKAAIDDAIKYSAASVCIAPYFVESAVIYAKGKIKICTVVGFPHGNSTTTAKVFETKEAVERGASEIDMVINIGELKAGNLGFVENELRAVKAAAKGKTLKVIIETSLLTEDEKIKMCALVSKVGAQYIKTSTGFSGGGATREDILLFKAHLSAGVKIKASGGIKTLQDAEEFIKLGCDRIGASSLIKLIKEQNP